jgi:hypothetical protein
MNIKEKSRKYWEIWQNYEEKDQAYRVALLISALLVFFLSAALAVSALKSPLIISIKNGVASATTYARDSDSIDENTFLIKSKVSSLQTNIFILTDVGRFNLHISVTAPERADEVI